MKLGTRLFIFSSIFLVMLPFFGFHFMGKIEQFLLQGQEEAQSMVASAISTALKGYTRLFNVDKNAHYVYPIKQNIMVDGYARHDEDWTRLEQQFTSYENDKFSLLLIDNSQYLYAYLKVNDNNIIYRNPRYVPLDSSDHIRIEYLDVNNDHRRLVLLSEGQGSMSVYEVNNNWQTWKSDHHLNTVYAIWRETDSGYDVELRLPRKWLDPNHRLSIAVVDVFGENERSPDTIISSHILDPEVPGSAVLNPLIFQSYEISSVIKNLSEFDSRICVIDRYRRVRSEIGGQSIHSSFCQTNDKVSEKWAQKVLSGEEQVISFEEDGGTLIVAAHPVFDGEEVIGAVLVGKNSRQILSRHRDTLIDIIIATLVLFFLVTISLFIFSSWLAFRINRLKNQTASLIDDSGRFISHIDLADTKHHDEIGDLSRSFSSLLDKLNSYTGFLETVPRMLRHEILNPVNTISMSLQSLKQQCDSADKTQDIKAACNAIEQLQLIVSSLTEAASIDEALTQDEVETFDIAALITEYVQNLQLRHTAYSLRYYGVQSGVYVQGNDIRMVQLLDKIKDNALDFAVLDSEISFHLDINQHQQVVIRVKNQGETIPQQQLDVLFRGMVSFRSDGRSASQSDRAGSPHLGIGLYVAQKISQFHQGQLKITNRRDKQGVEVVLILPTVNK